MTQRRIVIGTRQSQLAVWQADYVTARLKTLYPDSEVVLQFFVTHGDRVIDRPLPEIGGKGVFTAELESALLAGEIDLAVHSLKDLPTDLDAAFTIGAIPERASPYDALISRTGQALAALPNGATVGTSSLRRVAQIKAARPDLKTLSLRGNVPTRINKALAADGPYDAIVLAEAGLDRLAMAGHITEILTADMMLPAPAQGALAIQCRADDTVIRSLLAPLNHLETQIAVEAERAFLNALDSGCRLPVAALAKIDGAILRLTGRVASLDGSTLITLRESIDTVNHGGAIALGIKLAQAALEQGAGDLLDTIRDAMRKDMPA
ncbi:MAG: hydroxymethylbilane synthase [Chloroflexota bacterium]